MQQQPTVVAPRQFHRPFVNGEYCRTGLLPEAVLEDFADFDDVEIFASGSPAMVYALLDACEERGFVEEKMHSDVFAYAPRPK